MSRSVLSPEESSEIAKSGCLNSISKRRGRGEALAIDWTCSLKDGTIAYLWPDGTLERSDDRWQVLQSKLR